MSVTLNRSDIFQDDIILGFTVNELLDISFTIPATTTIDCAALNIRIGNELVNGRPTQTEHTVHIGRSDLTLLLNELRTIDDILGEYETASGTVTTTEQAPH